MISQLLKLLEGICRLFFTSFQDTKQSKTLIRKFTPRSEKCLEECHIYLRRIANETLKYTDFEVICGYRNEEDQNKAFDKGASQLKYPNSKHNKIPSLAFDVIPKPFKGWADTKSFENLAAHIMASAAKLGIYVKWGGNFKFKDLVHFELEEK